MTEVERWKRACERAGILLQDWLNKNPGARMFLPSVVMIASILKEASLVKIEQWLDTLEGL